MLTWVLFGLFAGALARPDPFWTTGCGESKYPDAGEGQPISHIVGGQEARANEFPYQVTLMYNGRFTCGAVIMNADYVLTAAHCVHNRETPATNFDVIVGNHNVNAPDNSEVTINVAEVIKHENYGPVLIQNDIALLRLATPITFNADVVGACAPDAATDYTGEICTVSGWGTLQYGSSNYPDILNWVNLPITDQTACAERYSTLTDDMICAGDPFEDTYDACQGDSGGPLACKHPDGTFHLVGLVSWGEGCASGKPGVYNRVQYFLDWINDNTGGW